MRKIPWEIVLWASKVHFKRKRNLEELAKLVNNDFKWDRTMGPW